MKRFISIFILLLTLTVAVNAEEVLSNGINYEVINKTKRTLKVIPLPDGQKYAGALTIPNTVNHKSAAYYVSEIAEGCFSDSPELTYVQLPNGLNSIPKACFSNCPRLMTVIGGGNVTEIGVEAFAECTKLVNVGVPSAATETIGNYAFYKCSSLKRINIPASVTSIGIGCFRFCTSLTTIEGFENVTSIGTSCFEMCQAMESITLPSTLGGLPDMCFQGCVALKQVDMSYNIWSIGSTCFNGCSCLETVRIPASVKNIGYNAFVDCESLKSIEVEKGNRYYTSIDGVLYGTDLVTTLPTKLVWYPAQKTGEEYSTPASVSTIASNACSLNSYLQRLVLTSVSEVGNYAFSQCENLKEVTFVDELISELPTGMFFNCQSLETINIPSTVGRINTRCFFNCSSLKTLTVTAPPNYTWIVSAAFEDASLNDAVIYTNAEYVEDYLHDSTWGIAKDIQAIKECEAPQIINDGGQLIIYSNTEGSTCHYSLSFQADSQGYSPLKLQGVYVINAFATAPGHLTSKHITKMVTLSATSGKEGDVNGDGFVNMEDAVKVVDIFVTGK